MRALLFRYRLTVILIAFAVAVGAAMTQNLWAKSELIWARPLALWVDAAWCPLAVLWGSGGLCLLAFWLRTAAEARLHEDVYGQGETTRLVVQGPFAWLRNPLYLGTWTFFTSAVVLWTPVVIWLLLSLIFFLALDGMVRHEETLLADRYGDAYRSYCQRVWRWLPWPSRAPQAQPPAWSDYAWAALGNLGLGSLGLFRIAVALGVPVRYAGPVNLVCLILWVAVVVSRRSDRTGSEPG